VERAYEEVGPSGACIEVKQRGGGASQRANVAGLIAAALIWQRQVPRVRAGRVGADAGKS
jgi:hypothetical protein